MQQNDFRAAFTTAEGWGRFVQNVQGGRQENAVELRYGKQTLKELTLDTAPDVKITKAEATIDGRRLETKVRLQPQQTNIFFSKELDLSAGQILKVKLS